jgi:uncharacterized protein YfaT (DUF1175 family)
VTSRKVLLLTLVAAAILTAALARSRHHAPFHLTDIQLTQPADGAFHPVARLSEPVITTGLPTRCSHNILEARSPVNPGTGRLTLQAAHQSKTLTLHFLAATQDSFADGTPDFLRLHTAEDRTAFRNWFTALADTAAALPYDKVPHEINDCAALLRWCYRNTLHAHDEPWQATMPFAALPPLSSITQYTYPNTPLAAGLFRTKPGAYEAADPQAFAQFADARSLLLHNTFFLTRDVRLARPGDLLFFRQLEQNSHFHSMILTGPAHNWAVYHTGPIGSAPHETPGEIRRVALSDLLNHPDARWRPVPANSNFLGVYRWNILREDPR